jgi:hypothetical protein
MRIAPIAGWILTAAVALAPAAAWAQEAVEVPRGGTAGHTAEWNGEEVAVIADNLAKAVRDARREARNTPRPGVGGGQETGWFLFTDKLRLIRLDAQQLARAARAGRSHDEVHRTYQRMWVLIRDAQETGKRLAITQQLEAKIQLVRGFLDQLDAYFD